MRAEQQSAKSRRRKEQEGRREEEGKEKEKKKEKGMEAAESEQVYRKRRGVGCQGCMGIATYDERSSLPTKWLLVDVLRIAVVCCPDHILTSEGKRSFCAHRAWRGGGDDCMATGGRRGWGGGGGRADRLDAWPVRIQCDSRTRYLAR